jgi:TRAP-type mannitol/chloroaromatic compound transport system permease large subunit
MRALSPRSIKTSDIILGVMPFIALIVMMALALALFPQLITWLPDTLYNTK